MNAFLPSLGARVEDVRRSLAARLKNEYTRIMSTPARLSLSFVSVVLLAAAIVGCGKKEEEPVVLAMPSATAPAPVKAAEDPAPAATPQPIAAGGSAAAVDTAAAPATPPPAAEAPKGPAPSIEGCCSALQNMTRDAKLDAVTKSKATAALGMCNATAPLVKSGKAPRATALTQIKATMGGSAPSACN